MQEDRLEDRAEDIVLPLVVGAVADAHGPRTVVAAEVVERVVWEVVPELAEAMGFRHWMYALLASLYTLLICLRQPKLDRNWLGFAVVSVITILMTGSTYDRMTMASILANRGCE